MRQVASGVSQGTSAACFAVLGYEGTLAAPPRCSNNALSCLAAAITVELAPPGSTVATPTILEANLWRSATHKQLVSQTAFLGSRREQVRLRTLATGACVPDASAAQ